MNLLVMNYIINRSLLLRWKNFATLQFLKNVTITFIINLKTVTHRKFVPNIDLHKTYATKFLQTLINGIILKV